jgi:hypothetical protein
MKGVSNLTFHELNSLGRKVQYLKFGSLLIGLCCLFLVKGNSLMDEYPFLAHWYLFVAVLICIIFCLAILQGTFRSRGDDYNQALFSLISEYTTLVVKGILASNLFNLFFEEWIVIDDSILIVGLNTLELITIADLKKIYLRKSTLMSNQYIALLVFDGGLFVKTRFKPSSSVARFIATQNVEDVQWKEWLIIRFLTRTRI